MIKVGFKKVKYDAVLPVKAHLTDSGFDLFANEDVIIEPGETKVIKTGIAIKLPPGYEAQVRPRSGITSKTKLRVQIGTIDNSYVGEIGIIVDNTNPENNEDGDEYILRLNDRYDNIWNHLDSFNDFTEDSYLVKKGDRLAQLVIAPVPMVESYEIDELPVTDRGSNGFGSSGI